MRPLIALKFCNRKSTLSFRNFHFGLFALFPPVLERTRTQMSKHSSAMGLIEKGMNNTLPSQFPCPFIEIVLWRLPVVIATVSTTVGSWNGDWAETTSPSLTTCLNMSLPHIVWHQNRSTTPIQKRIHCINAT